MRPFTTRWRGWETAAMRSGQVPACHSDDFLSGLCGIIPKENPALMKWEMKQFATPSDKTWVAMKERHSEARTTAMKAAMNPFAKGAGAIDRNLNGDVQMTWVLAFLKSGFCFDLLWVEREVGTCGRARRRR